MLNVLTSQTKQAMNALSPCLMKEDANAALWGALAWAGARSARQAVVGKAAHAPLPVLNWVSVEEVPTYPNAFYTRAAARSFAAMRLKGPEPVRSTYSYSINVKSVEPNSNRLYYILTFTVRPIPWTDWTYNHRCLALGPTNESSNQ